MGFCAENNVTITFLTAYGHFLANVYGQTSGNVLLRREQYRRADDAVFSAKLARTFITGKVANCRTVLQRLTRDHKEKIPLDSLEKASRNLTYSLDQLQKESSLDVLRGIEGDSAHTYFGVFDHLIVAQKDDFKFQERSRRPPLDEVNCLLSFLYTLLTYNALGIETVGLDPQVGYLHRDRPGRPGLALDMIEEMRPFLADRLALSLINREQVKKKGFSRSESGAVLMDDETRKEVLVAYQNRKQEEILHPFLKENMPIGLLFYVQALLFARYLRGDLDGYPVFIWK